MAWTCYLRGLCGLGTRLLPMKSSELTRECVYGSVITEDIHSRPNLITLFWFIYSFGLFICL
jgi:hypothetical protein